MKLLKSKMNPKPPREENQREVEAEEEENKVKDHKLRDPEWLNTSERMRQTQRKTPTMPKTFLSQRITRTNLKDPRQLRRSTESKEKRPKMNKMTRSRRSKRKIMSIMIPLSSKKLANSSLRPTSSTRETGGSQA